MGNAIDERLGRQLLRRRRDLGLTQHQLAAAIGIRFQQIHKYECGASRMSGPRLWALANALDVDVNYFFEGLAAEAPTRETDPRRPTA